MTLDTWKFQSHCPHSEAHMSLSKRKLMLSYYFFLPNNLLLPPYPASATPVCTYWMQWFGLVYSEH